MYNKRILFFIKNRLVHYTVAVVMVFTLTIFSANKIFAEDYVLPYPGFMPGHPLYKISSLVDLFEQWWSFGSFAKFKYHLGIADKKLVETKTLFEYRQYLLAEESLKDYKSHINMARDYFIRAQNEGKNIKDKQELFKLAIKKHRNVLAKLKMELPTEILWVPEKREAQTIKIHAILDEAITTNSIFYNR